MGKASINIGPGEGGLFKKWKASKGLPRKQLKVKTKEYQSSWKNNISNTNEKTLEEVDDKKNIFEINKEVQSYPDRKKSNIKTKDYQSSWEKFISNRKDKNLAEINYKWDIIEEIEEVESAPGKIIQSEENSSYKKEGTN